ncbi:MAG: hypothetical protein V4689_17550 [Verrucomicrobiota bacterium]
MARRDVFIKAALVLIVVWACVWGIRAYAGSRKITAERVNREVAAAKFTDWSGGVSAAETARRETEIRKIAGLVNRLDFQEREKNRENRTGENFFRKLSPDEKGLFINLTIVESMSRFMESLDAMKPDQRKKFVEQGLKEIQSGKTGEEMARADELGADLLDKISEEGMKAYFEKSSTDTKLDLAPLMEAMNETMQGLRGNEFGPRQR